MQFEYMGDLRLNMQWHRTATRWQQILKIHAAPYGTLFMSWKVKLPYIALVVQYGIYLCARMCVSLCVLVSASVFIFVPNMSHFSLINELFMDLYVFAYGRKWKLQGENGDGEKGINR